jgi:hypothetical protein
MALPFKDFMGMSQATSGDYRCGLGMTTISTGQADLEPGDWGYQYTQTTKPNTTVMGRVQGRPPVARRIAITQMVAELEFLAGTPGIHPRVLAQKVWQARKAMMGTSRWSWANYQNQSSAYDSYDDLAARLTAVERVLGVGDVSPKVMSQLFGMNGLGAYSGPAWGQTVDPIAKLASCIRAMLCKPPSLCCDQMPPSYYDDMLFPEDFPAPGGGGAPGGAAGAPGTASGRPPIGTASGQTGSGHQITSSGTQGRTATGTRTGTRTGVPSVGFTSMSRTGAQLATDQYGRLVGHTFTPTPTAPTPAPTTAPTSRMAHTVGIQHLPQGAAPRTITSTPTPQTMQLAPVPLSTPAPLARTAGAFSTPAPLVGAAGNVVGTGFTAGVVSQGPGAMVNGLQGLGARPAARRPALGRLIEQLRLARLQVRRAR